MLGVEFYSPSKTKTYELGMTRTTYNKITCTKFYKTTLFEILSTLSSKLSKIMAITFNTSTLFYRKDTTP